MIVNSCNGCKVHFPSIQIVIFNTVTILRFVWKLLLTPALTGCFYVWFVLYIRKIAFLKELISGVPLGHLLTAPLCHCSKKSCKNLSSLRERRALLSAGLNVAQEGGNEDPISTWAVVRLGRWYSLRTEILCLVEKLSHSLHVVG